MALRQKMNDASGLVRAGCIAAKRPGTLNTVTSRSMPS
jgi:hypothetical protein